MSTPVPAVCRELLLLPIHIGAGRCAGDGADAGADDALGAIVAAAEQLAEQIAGTAAQDRADRGLGDAPLAGVRIGDAGGGGGEQGGRGRGGRNALIRHTNTFLEGASSGPVIQPPLGPDCSTSGLHRAEEEVVAAKGSG